VMVWSARLVTAKLRARAPATRERLWTVPPNGRSSRIHSGPTRPPVDAADLLVTTFKTAGQHPWRCRRTDRSRRALASLPLRCPLSRWVGRRVPAFPLLLRTLDQLTIFVGILTFLLIRHGVVIADRLIHQVDASCVRDPAGVGQCRVQPLVIEGEELPLVTVLFAALALPMLLNVLQLMTYLNPAPGELGVGRVNDKVVADRDPSRRLVSAAVRRGQQSWLRRGITDSADHRLLVRVIRVDDGLDRIYRPLIYSGRGRLCRGDDRPRPIIEVRGAHWRGQRMTAIPLH